MTKLDPSTITGDNSVGILDDQVTAIMNGNLTMGNISCQPSTSSSTAPSASWRLNTSRHVQRCDIDVVWLTDGTTAATAGSIKALGSAGTTSRGIIGMDLAGTINGDVTISQGLVRSPQPAPGVRRAFC